MRHDRRRAFSPHARTPAARPRRFRCDALSLGGAGLGGLYGPVPEEAALQTVRRALDHGINYIEGAPFYGECERRYGKLLTDLGGRPAGLHLCTKVGMHPARHGDYSGATARWSVEESLRVLGVSSVDLVQVHALDSIDMDFVLGPAGAVRELERMRDEGKLRAIGFAIRGGDYHRRAIASGRFDVILIHDDFSLIRRTDVSVIEEAHAAGVGVLAARVLMTGLLAGGDPMTNERLAAHPDVGAARDWWLWARASGVPLQAVALQFAMRHPGVSSVVVGASYPAEVDENVTGGTFPLPGGIWDEVEERIRRFA